MLNTLLFIHLITALLLVVVILLQKTSTDGLSGLGGSGNAGIMSGRSAANFLTRTTIILAVAFFVNAIILANLSTKKHVDFSEKLEKLDQNNSEENVLPIAK